MVLYGADFFVINPTVTDVLISVKLTPMLIFRE